MANLKYKNLSPGEETKFISEELFKKLYFFKTTDIVFIVYAYLQLNP